MNQLSFSFADNFIDKGVIKHKLGIVKTKICSKCKIEYEATLENFGRYKNTLQSYCKTCKHIDDYNRQFITKDNSLCKYCNNKRLPNSNVCAYHKIYTNVANQRCQGRFKHLKSKEETKSFVLALLSKLEAQEYRCAISNVPIELGVNASIDHINEFCNGGSCDLDNLQWVSKSANSRKARKYKDRLK